MKIVLFSKSYSQSNAREIETDLDSIQLNELVYFDDKGDLKGSVKLTIEYYPEDI